jgi:hypothetical protein
MFQLFRNNLNVADKGFNDLQMGMSVLTKAEDFKAGAVETVIPSAESSEPDSPDALPKRQCVNVSEDAKDDADSNDGWETHSLLEELLNDVTPYTAAGIFLSSDLLLKCGLVLILV